MKIIDFRSVRKGSLVGFCAVEMPSGMIIRDVGIFEKDGSTWASPPSRQFTANDGKVRYQPIVEFTTKEIRDKWTNAVRDAFLAAYQKQDA